MAYGAAGRKRVAGHEVAALQRAFRLIVQRRANVLDRIDEVQAGGEQRKVVAGRGRRHRELGEIEQRTGMRRADRPGRDRNGTRRPAAGAALPRAPLRRRRGRSR